MNRRSVQFLFGSGDGGEEADKNDVDCLVEYGRFLTGWPLAHCELHTSWDGNRSIDDDDKRRDSKNAHRGYCTWRPYNVEHDSLTSIFHQRFTRGDAEETQLVHGHVSDYQCSDLG